MIVVVVVAVAVVVFWGVFMLSIKWCFSKHSIPMEFIGGIYSKPFVQLRNHPGQVRELPAIAQRFFGGCFHSCWINEHGCVWKCGAYVHAIYGGFNGEMGFETMNFGWYFWKNVTNSHYNNCNRINNRQGFKLTLHHRLINHRSITIITRKNSKIYWFITLFYPSWTLIARSEFIQQQ